MGNKNELWLNSAQAKFQSRTVIGIVQDGDGTTCTASSIGHLEGLGGFIENIIDYVERDAVLVLKSRCISNE